MNRVLAVLALAAFAAGCAGVIKQTRTNADWETLDKDRVKRLVIVTQPLPDGQQALGDMWSKMAAKRVDLKREFIVKETLARDEVGQPDVNALCGATEGAEGVLWLRPVVQKKGGGVEAQVVGHLYRCVDGAEVWMTEAGGSWDSKEEKLKETIADYTSEFGAGVEPYVAASYHLINDTVDTLPNPVLTDEDKGDKIENTQ